MLNRFALELELYRCLFLFPVWMLYSSKLSLLFSWHMRLRCSSVSSEFMHFMSTKRIWRSAIYWRKISTNKEFDLQLRRFCSTGCCSCIWVCRCSFAHSRTAARSRPPLPFAVRNPIPILARLPLLIRCECLFRPAKCCAEGTARTGPRSWH